jgi:hypothetical protein
MQTRFGQTGVYDYNRNRSAVNKWLADNNADISIRGLESETIAKMSDKQRLKIEKKLEKLREKPNKAIEFYLKMFLQKGDVGVAKASFIAHYKTYLQRQGKSTDIKFDKPMDPDAKAYAQQMVDRHQNVSIGGLQGQAFTNQTIWADVARKVLMPFANFVINAKVRTAADIRTIAAKGVDSDAKWRAGRSIAGTVAEIATYRAMASMINMLLQQGVYALSGYDPEDDDPEINKEVKRENDRRMKTTGPMDDQEEKAFRQQLLTDRFWDNFMKTSATQAVTDLLSPMPPFDAGVLLGANKMIEPLTEPSKEDIAKAVAEEEAHRKDLGVKPWKLVGTIPVEKSEESYKYFMAAKEGVIESESATGKTKRYLTSEDQEMAKWGAFAKLLYMSRLAPTEVGYAADKLMKGIEKSSMTAKQKTQQDDAILFLEYMNEETLSVEEKNLIKSDMGGFEAIVDSRFKGVDDKPKMLERMVYINEIADVSGLPKSEVIKRIGKKDICF